MGFSPLNLENPRWILSRFNEASTTSLGDIVLPVQVGPVTLNVQFSIVEDLSPLNAILGRTWLHDIKTIPFTYHQMVSYLTLNVRFSIVEDLSPFNAILGRTWLHDMKVIPSTYQQMVSYLTENGQIDLYGSQLAARQCYQVGREAGSNNDNEPSLKTAIAADQ